MDLDAIMAWKLKPGRCLVDRDTEFPGCCNSGVAWKIWHLKKEWGGGWIVAQEFAEMDAVLEFDRHKSGLIKMPKCPGRKAWHYKGKRAAAAKWLEVCNYAKAQNLEHRAKAAELRQLSLSANPETAIAATLELMDY